MNLAIELCYVALLQHSIKTPFANIFDGDSFGDLNHSFHDRGPGLLAHSLLSRQEFMISYTGCILFLDI